jgi:transforming growth factor-beta-induced protein
MNRISFHFSTTAFALTGALAISGCADESDDGITTGANIDDSGETSGNGDAADDDSGAATMNASDDAGDDTADDTADGADSADGSAEMSVYDIACATEGYESLCAAVDKAGLDGVLDDPEATFTVFAPNNDAFAALLGAVGASSLDDVSVAQLTPILLYHVMGQEVDSVAASEAAAAGAKIDAIGGGIQLSTDGSAIFLDGVAAVDVPDVFASNGVVHGIDAVILPSITDIVVTNDDFSSLEAALGLADSDSSDPMLVGTLDDNDGVFTVFAPTDDAFAGLMGALPAEAGISALADLSSAQVLPILKYHVLAGAAVGSADVSTGPVSTLGGTVQADTNSGVMVDGSNVVVADIIAANGIIHVVDGVLVPSIADVVTTAPEFEQLAGLVGAADGDAMTSPKVGAALDGAATNGAWTVFAPTNDAISGVVQALGPNTPAGQDLTNILLFHAIDGAAPGVFASTAVTLDNASVPTALPGSGVVVDGGSGVTVSPSVSGSATVVATDYICSNGVVHVIDDVLIPSP